LALKVYRDHRVNKDHLDPKVFRANKDLKENQLFKKWKFLMMVKEIYLSNGLIMKMQVRLNINGIKKI
jgi:hypothetical protein